MLPALPTTDVLLLKPDVDGLDLWAPDFSAEKVPALPGVYCFYATDTGEVLYIGSACARSSGLRHSGLLARLTYYRGVVKDDTSRRIHTARAGRKLLTRCWVAQSAGDAVKYEGDAIEKYKPSLNLKLAKTVQNAEGRAVADRRLALKYRSRSEADLPLVTTRKRCNGCNKVKALSAFYRLATQKDGHVARCRSCMKAYRTQLNREHHNKAPDALPSPDSLKLCSRCKTTKPRSGFCRDFSSSDNYNRWCRECTSSWKRGKKGTRNDATSLV